MTLYLVSHATRPRPHQTARAAGAVDLVVDGINLTARVGPGQALPFLRDLSLVAADLASARRDRGAVRYYQRDEVWEVGLERDGDDVLVSVFRTGPDPDVAVREHRARGERLIAALLAACEAAAPGGPRGGHAELAYARGLLAGLAPWAPGPALPPPVEVTVETSDEAPLRLGCRAPLRPRRGEATPGVERSDLASLLARGPLWLEARGRRSLVEGALVVLVAERLVALALEMLAHARRGAAFARHESVGNVRIGLRCEPVAGCRLTLGPPGRAASAEAPPLPPEAIANVAFEFGRALTRALVRHDRAQGHNLRLGAFRQELRRLGEALRPAEAPAAARLNADPESFRAYALAEAAPRPAAGPPTPAAGPAADAAPLGPGRLRYAPRWEALVPGLDLQSTFLCGDRLVVSGRRETACLDRAGGEVLWRRPTAPARSVPSPGGLARLYADGRVEVLDYGTGEVALAITLAAPRAGTPGGAVVNAPGLPRLLVVAEGERHLTAIDLVSGELRWRHARARGGPCRLRRAGRLLLENAGDGTLTAFDIPTGELVWRLCEREPFSGPPVFDHDTVYAAVGDGSGGRLLLIDPWSGAVRRRVALPAAPEPDAAPLVSAGAVALLVRAEGGEVAVAGFERESGEPRFAPGPFAAPAGSAWLAVDATFFCNTEAGEAAGLRDADGSVVFRTKLGDGVNPPRRLEPVLRSGALFVPQGDGVHLLRPRDGSRVGHVPTELVPDLLRVDERCDLYVAEESGHLRAFGLGPRLAVVRLAPDARALRAPGRSEPAEAHRGAPGVDDAEVEGGGAREVDDGPAVEGAAVVDAHDDAALTVLDQHARAEGQRAVGGGAVGRIVGLAARGLLAREGVGVKRSLAARARGRLRRRGGRRGRGAPAGEGHREQENERCHASRLGTARRGGQRRGAARTGWKTTPARGPETGVRVLPRAAPGAATGRGAQNTVSRRSPDAVGWQPRAVMDTPDLQPFVKQPLGGIDRRALVQRLSADGPRVAASDLARARAALRPVGIGLPSDHAVLLLGGSGGILRAVAIQLLFGERAAVSAVHYDSEKLQMGYHHARALSEAAAEAGVGCTFYNQDAARPDAVERVVADLAARYRVVHLVNGIAAGATKRFAEHGPTRVRELDVAFDPVRQVPDFSSWSNLRKIGLAEVEVATDADIERTYKYMGRSTLPWAEALAAAGLLRKGESLVAFTDYEYEPDDPVYAHGPLCRAKVLQRESLAEIKERFGTRTARLCYPAVNTTALGAIPGGILMFAGTAQILRERGAYANLPALAHDTTPAFSLDHPGGDLRLDLPFQEVLTEFHRRKALLTPHNLRENFSLVFESEGL